MARHLAVLTLAVLMLAGCGDDEPTPEVVAESICAAADTGADALDQGRLHEDVPEDVWEDALDIAVEECPDDLVDPARLD